LLVPFGYTVFSSSTIVLLWQGSKAFFQ